MILFSGLFAFVMHYFLQFLTRFCLSSAFFLFRARLSFEVKHAQPFGFVLERELDAEALLGFYRAR
ncbi:hypothetical protein CXF64_19355 [Pseudoalteromonas sp. GutCa3]|nr:hypothetical protein CXF75_02050 [Pseudoalteromonas arctica]PKG68777.1 hypothetical protein CXF64_19355 [Pseudoalteromonas sp. GutCa3]